MCEMLNISMTAHSLLAATPGSLSTAYNVVLMLMGFSVVVFFHELGHFAVAKWCDVRVERFAIGFGPELFGFNRGETRYSFNIFPLGGYVKMLGQEDFEVDASGERLQSDDPRSFTNKTVGQRMAVVSAGVIMNLIFAALLFMVVYMIGKRETLPVVGAVIADYPAARAGLQVGDRIVAVNDSDIVSFEQIMLAVRLAAPLEPLTFTIERDGQLLTKSMTPKQSDVIDALQVGIAPKMTREIVYVDPVYLKDSNGPEPGDVIREINGVELDDSKAVTYMDLLMRGRNQPSRMVVERPDPDHPQATPRTVAFEVKKQVVFLPRSADHKHSGDLLGLVPRVRVTDILRHGAADDAGFHENDIIEQWGGMVHPTGDQIYRSILEHDGQDIPVTLVRDGKALRQPMYYRPVVVDTDGRHKPKLGFELGRVEQDRILVAGIISDPRTPASKSALSAGCEILEVSGEAVDGWADLAEAFRLQAGQTVQLTYLRPGGNSRAQTSLSIPRSISTVLGLPAFSPGLQKFNFMLDDQSEVRVKLGEQQDYETLPATRWDVVQAYLAERVGEVVNVTYETESGEMITVPLEVQEDMLDPWYRRVSFEVPIIQARPETYVNRKTNPLTAIWAGVRQTHYSVASAYLTLQRLIFTRSVGVENISGPVGIIHAGAKVAQMDKIGLLFLLAFLSANLAVINFLPLPIVDGGLMVFLVIEKIKGSPVSIKTQVITQIIGIALIGTTFLFVTFNDISRIFG